MACQVLTIQVTVSVSSMGGKKCTSSEWSQEWASIIPWRDFSRGVSACFNPSSTGIPSKIRQKLVTNPAAATTDAIVFTFCCCSVAQSCPTLSNPMDCRTPDSSVHGILQTRILEWVAMASSRGSSWPRDWTGVSCISYNAGSFFITMPPDKPCI